MRLLLLIAGPLLCSLMPALAQVQTARQLTLVNGTLPAAQRLIVATKGEALRWRLDSNVAGTVHVHAYRVSVALRPGQAVDLAFTAHATGRFRIEWHAAGEAGPGPHHAPPLAMLEVRPP